MEQPQYISFNIQDLEERAKRMPISFLDDYKSVAIGMEFGAYVLYAEDADRLAAKYKGYAVSSTYEERRQNPDAPIHGCCDRADQY